MKYDYYTVAVPGDCADTLAELADVAINEARERARLYAIPAEWLAVVIRGEIGDCNVTFRVRRKRR